MQQNYFHIDWLAQNSLIFFLLGCFINDLTPTTIDQRQNELTKNERVREKSFKIKLSQHEEFTVFVVTTAFSHWNF